MFKKIEKIGLTILLCFLIINLTGCSEKETKENNNKSTTTSIKKPTTEEIQNNITAEAVGITEYGDYLIKLKNENNIPVYIEDVIVKFFDKEGNFAKKDSTHDSYFCIPANSEIVTYIWGYNQEFEKYSKSEIDIQFSEPFYEYFTENFEIKANDTGEQIAVTVVNNNDAELDAISINVAFLKNGKIVGIENGTSYEEGIESNGGTAYINVSYPKDSDFEDITYDDFKVYLISAHK